MKVMTQQNMINAFGGESMANMRYRHFAVQAEKERYPQVARLFRAIAHAEFIHAGDHYQVIKQLNDGYVANSMGAFGPGDTLKNLELAIAGETFEIDEMYPTYMAVAEFQEEKNAYRSFNWSYQTEIQHKKLFEKARNAVVNQQDAKLEAIAVCLVCGYTLEGEAPDSCPVCMASKERFKSYQTDDRNQLPNTNRSLNQRGFSRKTAQDVLDGKGLKLVSIAEDATITEAAAKMVSKRIGAILVKRGNDIVGLWTERHFLRNILSPDFSFNQDTARIGDYMIWPVHTAPFDASLEKLQDMMLGLFTRYILIEKNGVYIGLISIGDVLRTVLLEKDEEIKSLNKIASWEYYENWGWHHAYTKNK